MDNHDPLPLSYHNNPCHWLSLYWTWPYDNYLHSPTIINHVTTIHLTAICVDDLSFFLFTYEHLGRCDNHASFPISPHQPAAQLRLCCSLALGRLPRQECQGMARGIGCGGSFEDVETMMKMSIVLYSKNLHGQWYDWQWPVNVSLMFDELMAWKNGL